MKKTFLEIKTMKLKFSTWMEGLNDKNNLADNISQNKI